MENKENKRSLVQKVNKAVLGFIIGKGSNFLYRVKVEGIENIPMEGSLIFCGNHKTYLDPVIIVLNNPREVKFMAKEELKKNPLFALLCHVFEVIFVKRDSKDIAPLKEAMKSLKSGKCIGIFPEGTRNGMEKNNGEMKNGAAYMAIKTGSPIVPVGVIGGEKIFHKTRLVFGKPIDVTPYQSKDKSIEKENQDKLTNALKEEIIKLTKSES